MKTSYTQIRLFIFSIFTFFGFSLFAQWSAVGPSANNIVHALFRDTVNNLLYLGGDFTNPATRIATWNGSAFAPVSAQGMNTGVFTIGMYAGNIYAAGNFTTAGGNSCSKIAMWDGVNWNPLGTGINNNVYCMAEYNGELWVGGSFNTAGGNQSYNISRWTGSAWVNMGTQTDNAVRSMCVWNGELYVGGDFTTICGTPANRIAKWNGVSWSALGVGTDARVAAMTVYQGQLVCGGFFNNAGGSPALYIAQWNGSGWSALGAGMNLDVKALSVFQNELYAGGSFTMAGSVTANRIAKWNGSAWAQVSAQGMNNDVRALASPYGGYLFAGGNFTLAGGVMAFYIAKWQNITIGIKDPKTYNLKVFPNPSKDIFYFETGNDLLQISLYDIAGRFIRREELIDDKLDLASLPSGVYLMHWNDGNASGVSRLIVK